MNKKIHRYLVIATSFISILIVWMVLNRMYPSSIPSPFTVLKEIVEILKSGDFISHILHTLFRVLFGFFIAFIIAFCIGYTMMLRQEAEDFWRIWLLFGLTIPSLVCGMLAIIWFKISELAPITAVVMVLTPVLSQDILQGFKAIDSSLIEMARTFSVRYNSIFLHTILPQLIPQLLALSRYGLSLAWKVTVIAEMLGLSNGIGYQINYNFGLFRTEGVLAWTFLFIIIMVVIEYGIFSPLENYITKWRPKKVNIQW